MKRTREAEKPTAVSGNSAGLTRLFGAIERILANEGYLGITMRKIATEAGVSLGTVTYFGSKDSLIEAYVDRQIEWYFAHFDDIERRLSPEPRTAFLETIRFLISDITDDTSYGLFPELWAVATRNARVQSALNRLYGRERDWFERLLALGWPNLSRTSIVMIVGTLIPMIEGECLFQPASRRALYPNRDVYAAISYWLMAAINQAERQAILDI